MLKSTLNARYKKAGVLFMPIFFHINFKSKEKGSDVDEAV